MANAWNEATWGQNAWGEQSDVNETLTGEALTSSLGDETITADCNVTPTGVPITATEGTITDIIITVDAFPSGISFTANLGTADAGPDAMVTGLDTVTASVGSVEAYNLTGWGRYFWGQFVWNGTGDWVQVDLTGISLSANLGTADAAPDAEVTGIGFNASLAVGTVVIGEGNVDVTGEAMIASLGDSIGFTSIEVDLTGIGLSANVGTITATGTANVDVTGELMTAAEGTVDPSPDAEVTGIGFTADLAVGTVIIADANTDVIGEAITAATNPEGIPLFTAEADAQLSTAQAKFGPSSLLLDGTGDFVQSTATDVVQNNFTIEFFAYASNFAQDAYLWDNQSSNQGFAISITSAGQLRLIQDGTILQQTGTPSLNNNQWNHFALVQNSTLLTLYINGTPKLQYSTGGDSYPGQSYKIGTNEGETQFFNGYIDEFRSSDIARYTGLFTPPTSAFTADGNTISLLHFDGINGSTNIVNSTGSDIPRIALGLGQGQAELEAVTIANVTGQALEVGLRNAVAGASAEIFPTGVQANIALGNEVSQIWRFVDTGTTVSYTEVSTGTSVTWNDIDTAA